jgi:pimeloyl-ACP methyl ester carboxylesterase
MNSRRRGRPGGRRQSAPDGRPPHVMTGFRPTGELAALSARLLLPLCLAVASACSAHTPPIPARGGNRPVASLEAIRLGGVEQTVLLRGHADTLPVLLWLHGGPGATQMPVARHFNGALEEEFIVVHWDQRGAGKSNPRDFDATTMTFQRYVQDTHELTAYLKARFGHERIFLLGHSWGTQLGLRVVAERPQDYHAYIGVSQVVNSTAATETAHEWLTQRIRESGSRRHQRRLDEIAPPPYPEHDRYVRFNKLVDAYGGNFDVGFGRLGWIAFRSPEYTPGDLRAWLRGANRGSGPMWHDPDYRDFDAFRQYPRLEVPVHLFVGRNDYNTPLAVTARYFDVLDAPAGKWLVVFERAAHTPFLREAERFNAEVVNVRRRRSATVQETVGPDAYPRELEPPDVPPLGAPGMEAGAPADTLTPAEWKRHSLVPLPVVYYTPETRWAGGAAAFHSHRATLAGRPTVSSGSVIYTQNRQLSAEFRTHGYFGDGRYAGSVEGSYSRFPESFFGIGNATLAADEETFTARGGRVGIDVRRRVRPGLYLGAAYEFRSVDIVDAEPGGLLSSGAMPGADGGTASGAGLSVSFDTRDNVLSATTGSYHTASVTRLGVPFGGDFDMVRYTLDLRRFLPVRDGHVLGVQGYLRSTTGDVPFHLLPRLGGQSLMRGTLQSRYRDRHMVAGQAEYRLHVWRRIGVDAFVGAGQVAPRLGAVTPSELHYSVGYGLRVLLDPQERMKLRIDMGHGRGGASGLYITVGEAF